MGNLTLTEILSAWRDLFWIFVVPYKISHLFDNKNTLWLKIYPCFRSKITTCNLPTWPGLPCTLFCAEIKKNILIYLPNKIKSVDEFIVGLLKTIIDRMFPMILRIAIVLTTPPHKTCLPNLSQWIARI